MLEPKRWSTDIQGKVYCTLPKLCAREPSWLRFHQENTSTNVNSTHHLLITGSNVFMPSRNRWSLIRCCLSRTFLFPLLIARWLHRATTNATTPTDVICVIMEACIKIANQWRLNHWGSCFGSVKICDIYRFVLSVSWQLEPEFEPEWRVVTFF